MSASADPSFVPILRSDLIVVDIDGEAVAWSPAGAAPVALDPAARLMLDVVDGEASVADLAADVSDVVGLPAEVALDRVLEQVGVFGSAGLLIGSEPIDADPGIFVSPSSSCMEASSCTGRVTSVNVEIDGTRLRIACTSGRVARRLRRRLREHLVAEQCPLGFMVRSPRRLRGAHELTDRGGFVLGRAASAARAAAMVEHHLSALEPVPVDHVRLRARVLVRDGSAALALWPLLFTPSLDEAALVADGWDLVDRLAVDVHLPSLSVSPDGGGATGVPLRSIAVGAPSGVAPPTPAQLAAALAGEALRADRHDALDLATRLATSPAITPVPIDPWRQSAWWRLLTS